MFIMMFIVMYKQLVAVVSENPVILVWYLLNFYKPVHCEILRTPMARMNTKVLCSIAVDNQ